MALPVKCTEPKIFELVELSEKSGKIQKLLKVIKITDVESSCKNVLWLSKHDMVRLFPESNKHAFKRYVAISNKVYRVAISKMLKKGMVGVNRVQHGEILPSLTMIDSNSCVVVTSQVVKKGVSPARYMLFNIARYNSSGDANLNNPLILDLGKTRAKLKRMFRRHAIKEGQSYLFQSDNQQYKITVNHVIYNEQGKGVCTLGEDTKIDLVADPYSKISITEEVVNRPIESFKFELSVKGLKDKENPFPPIVSVEPLQEKIGGILKGETLVENKEWTLQLENGANLTVRFKEAKETRMKGLVCIRDVETSKLYKKVYAFDPAAKIIFDWNAAEITLSLFSNLQPKSITFEILGYSKTTRDNELKPFRKDWLSVQEFKERIYKMNTTFVQNQEFFVELKSGVYRVKVDKIVAPVKILDDKREKVKTKWRVNKDVPITVEEGFKLNPYLVHSSKGYPIRRLLLSVSPSKKSFFAASKEAIISESEILKALEADFKKKIVPHQIFHVAIGKDIFKVVVEEFDTNCDVEYSDEYELLGKVQKDTAIEFVNDPDDAITVLPESKPLDIKDPIAKLEELGVGGLSEQMKDIVREIFLGRGKLKNQMMRRGRKPEKGILFYGPPGTGKTALARNLAEMLKGENVRMITAPEIFNKYVGGSEGNVRKLFEPAEAAYKQLGDKSPLFVIIIDEIDGLLTARGEDGNTVRNSVVNQFLASIDGPQPLNNILVIGMTNRKDQIDPAALRSGRLGLHIEIPAPKQKGREKIFEIHTRSLKKEKLLGEKIDFKHLANLMDKCVGADIESVVKRATSYAVERLNLLDLPDKELDTHPDGISTMDDFLLAVKEIKKQKGDEEKLNPSAQRMYL